MANGKHAAFEINNEDEKNCPAAADSCVHSTNSDRFPSPATTVRSLFSRRWEEFRADNRFREVTIREFAFFTTCESAYRGSDWVKSAKTRITPEGASNWTIDGGNRKADSFKVEFVTDGYEISVQLSYSDKKLATAPQPSSRKRDPLSDVRDRCVYAPGLRDLTCSLGFCAAFHLPFKPRALHRLAWSRGGGVLVNPDPRSADTVPGKMMRSSIFPLGDTFQYRTVLHR